MNTVALITFAASLAKSVDPNQIIVDRNAAAAELEQAPSLIRLRFDGQRISPKDAAEKVRRGVVLGVHLKGWARTIDAYQRMVNENPKVQALLMSGATNDFTPRDWLDAALAFLDQAGVPVNVQEQIERLLPDDDGDEA